MGLNGTLKGMAGFIAKAKLNLDIQKCRAENGFKWNFKKKGRVYC